MSEDIKQTEPSQGDGKAPLVPASPTPMQAKAIYAAWILLTMTESHVTVSVEEGAGTTTISIKPEETATIKGALDARIGPYKNLNDLYTRMEAMLSQDYHYGGKVVPYGIALEAVQKFARATFSQAYPVGELCSLTNVLSIVP